MAYYSKLSKLFRVALFPRLFNGTKNFVKWANRREKFFDVS